MIIVGTREIIQIMIMVFADEYLRKVVRNEDNI